MWKQRLLPLAVGVATTTWRRAMAAPTAWSWCAKKRSTPRSARALVIPGSTPAGIARNDPGFAGRVSSRHMQGRTHELASHRSSTTLMPCGGTHGDEATERC